MTLRLTIIPTDRVADCEGLLLRAWTGYTERGGRVTVLVAAVQAEDPIAEKGIAGLLTEIPSIEEGGQPGARERWLASLGLDPAATSAEISQALRLRRAGDDPLKCKPEPTRREG